MIGFPPRTPFLIFNKHQEVPRSAERGQGLCPWTLPPLKRRAKLLNALRAALRPRFCRHTLVRRNSDRNFPVDKSRILYIINIHNIQG